MQRTRKIFVVALLSVCLLYSAAWAGEDSFRRPGKWKPSLSKLVRIKNVQFHQKMLQRIADENDGNRGAGTTGYDRSVSYIAFMLKISGYDVDIQDFDFPFFEELSDPVFEQLEPVPAIYTPNEPEGFATMVFSGSGDVSAAIQEVDLVIPPGDEPNTSTSGCEPEDFDGFAKDSIALIQRGSCSFYQKAMNAQNAGASAVIVFNEGQDGRQDAIGATLGSPEFNIPVIFCSYAIGKDLADTDDLVVRVKTDTLSETRTSQNVIARSRRGDVSNTLVVGAHLDSVLDGPGINDNGSGSATILETAMKMGWFYRKPKNKVIFAFWGAEELGLIGSTHWVEQLTPEELEQIKLYLNFDMVASPNYVRFVFDGDGSEGGNAGPAGSGAIEQFFVDYFGDKGLATDPTDLAGNSDYRPFMTAGVPVGGLFTGAGGLKTEEQAAVYGGVAGEPYDPNYHTEDDTTDNINYEVEKQMLKAIAASVQHYSEQSISAAAPLEMRTMAVGSALEFDYLGPYLER